MRKTVITGPTGAIGHALINKLLENDVEVYAICRPNSVRNKTLPKNSMLHIIECDLSELRSTGKVLPKDCDVFYHLGWSGTFGDARNNMELQIKNISYTLDAVELAHKCGCKVFVGAGSQAEYGRVNSKLTPNTPCFPENGYGMAKLCAGQMSRVKAQCCGMKHIWARILSIYGEGDGIKTLIYTAIQNMLEGKRFSMTLGEQLWDYLYSEDLAEAMLAMSDHGQDGSVYVVGCGQAMPLKKYVEIIRDNIDRNLEIGLGDRDYNKDQVMYLEADISTLTRDTGWLPKTSFDEGIKKLIVNVQRNGNYEQ